MENGNIKKPQKGEEKQKIARFSFSLSCAVYQKVNLACIH